MTRTRCSGTTKEGGRCLNEKNLREGEAYWCHIHRDQEPKETS